MSAYAVARLRRAVVLLQSEAHGRLAGTHGRRVLRNLADPLVDAAEWLEAADYPKALGCLRESVRLSRASGFPGLAAATARFAQGLAANRLDGAVAQPFLWEVRSVIQWSVLVYT